MRPAAEHLHNYKDPNGTHDRPLGRTRLQGLHPEYLTIEVTETALMRDTESSVRRLRAIKDLGVSVAVDDFGTGYSSLAYLQQFPVDCIKIDKSFTSAVVGSAESEALMRTFVQLGKDLGLTTLAEAPRPLAKWTCCDPIRSMKPRATSLRDRSNPMIS
jgi:predicted signal transduction protein with EAL and GGDEF domain